MSDFEQDVVPVDGGEVTITCIGHGTLMFEYNGMVIHVDPVGTEADYSKLPKADIVLITHDHYDHLDPEAMKVIRNTGTEVVDTPASHEKAKGTVTLKNGESATVKGIKVEAVAAYNTSPGRDAYHPKGRDNGYILTLGGKRFYIAADTEDTPEMKALSNIHVAFLPVNQPYTMTTAQAVTAAKAFRPQILYPYHYGDTNVREIVEGLKREKNIEVRIRNLQ
ncbi:MAG: MBL fold metallo-hydrolase [Spirochaetales bacterium]|nr:MBL fold metallo-hydrolase [Spirochaetales bacterium]